MQHYVIKFVSDLRRVSVVFSGYSGFPHQWNWPPWYNWNIVESGVKHPNPNSKSYLGITIQGYTFIIFGKQIFLCDQKWYGRIWMPFLSKKKTPTLMPTPTPLFSERVDHNVYNDYIKNFVQCSGITDTLYR